MVKIKLVTLLVVSALLVGCTSSLFTREVEVSKDIQDKTYENQKAEEKSPSPVPEKKERTPEPVRPTPAPTASVLQPEPRKTGEKLDFSALDKLSNKKFSWWIKLNNEHKPTTVTAEVKSLIGKYDGLYIGDPSKKAVYLTFDEGYENGYTPMILDTLKANNVKALFFVTGPYVKQQQALVKRMLDEGHLVGNHTINHPGLPDVDNATLENELYGLEKQFTSMYGKGFKYMRPPRGEYSERTLAAAKQLGYKTVFWSFAYLDYDTKNQKGADYAYKKVMDNLHNGAVILLHAVSRDNAEALDRIIKDIRAQGYEIRPFDL